MKNQIIFWSQHPPLLSFVAPKQSCFIFSFVFFSIHSNDLSFLHHFNFYFFLSDTVYINLFYLKQNLIFHDISTYPHSSSLSCHQLPKPTVISSTSSTATWSSWRLREPCHFIQSEWSMWSPRLPTSQRSRASNKMDRSPRALNPPWPIPQWPTAPTPSQTPAC